MRLSQQAGKSLVMSKGKDYRWKWIDKRTTNGLANNPKHQ